MRLILFLFCVLAGPALADPQAYRLDAQRSSVGFTYAFQGQPTQGTMPVRSADITLDLRDVSRSQVTVALDPSRARAGFVFATQTMKGPSILDTARFPTITFRSTRVTGTVNDARLTGDITIRGVTRPITLTAGLFQEQGVDPAQRDKLLIVMKGSVNRNDFGAGGWPDYVDERIDLNIRAWIDRVQ
ncbi:YceI family protein [Parasulfitobacter algicola]|uniref:YceI family protein n=1 Tax=Parasulfitobacter algicola TaxID=2614809 RepID=A0ABX2IM22_9RHOB|nr:YceI family protein [Sulfitobacter algicola]NSX53924.1 YceI family protein [Sulfitobacter algicola]